MPFVIIITQHEPNSGALLGFQTFYPDDREHWPEDGPMDELSDEHVENVFKTIVDRASLKLGLQPIELETNHPRKEERQFRVEGRYDIRVKLESIGDYHQDDRAVHLIEHLADGGDID